MRCGSWLVGTSVAGEWTVSSVMAAGITIIANMAATITAQTVGLGSPRGAGMIGLRVVVASDLLKQDSEAPRIVRLSTKGVATHRRFVRKLET